jgi:hypothetical protein
MPITDVKSVQCGFESHRPYQKKSIICRKNKQQRKALVPSLTPFGSSRAAVGYDRSSSMAFLV